MKFRALALAAALAGWMFAPAIAVAPAQAQNSYNSYGYSGPSYGGGYRGGYRGYYGGPRHYGNRYYGRRYYGNRYYGRRYYGRRNYNVGAGIAAGLLGAAIAAPLIAGPRYYGRDCWRERRIIRTKYGPKRRLVTVCR